MKTRVLAFFVAGMACAASASASPDRFDQSTNAFNDAVRSGMYDGGDDTPTMRRQKMKWTSALRDDVERLRAQDGGTLSKQSIAYIRQEWSRINTGR